MFPRRDIALESALPRLTEYWIPKPSEMGDEGYEGLFFRDVRVLADVPVADARDVMLWEHDAAKWVIEQAADEASFEHLALIAESYDPDNGVDSSPEDPEFPAGLCDSDWGLQGFDLGVAGLSYVMAATGFYPIASCRSHLGHSWSPAPVVLFASDEERLQRLQPLIAQSGCGLGTDTSRGKALLVVDAPSIVEMMALAERLFEARTDFRSLSKNGRTRSMSVRRKSTELSAQPRLF